MPTISCPHCGETNFALAGWEHLERCASCGRPLGRRTGLADLAKREARRFDSKRDRSPRRQSDSVAD
jgi:ribosomal protein L37E